MPTSSTGYSSEIVPDARLRRAVAAAGCACLLLAPVLGSVLPWEWRLQATGAVVVLTAAELTRLLRGQRLAGRYRLYGDGSLEVFTPDGGRRLARLAAGSVLLPGIAWLRFRAPDGRIWAELVTGNPRKNKDWRRLCVIFRLSTACYHSPRSWTRSRR